MTKYRLDNSKMPTSNIEESKAILIALANLSGIPKPITVSSDVYAKVIIDYIDRIQALTKPAQEEDLDIDIYYETYEIEQSVASFLSKIAKPFTKLKRLKKK